MISAIKSFIFRAHPASPPPRNSEVNQGDSVKRRNLADKTRLPEWTGRTVPPPAVKAAEIKLPEIKPAARRFSTAEMCIYAKSIQSRYETAEAAKVNRHAGVVDRFIETHGNTKDSETGVMQHPQQPSVLLNAPPRRIFYGAKLKILHAFGTQSIFVTPQGSRIHVDITRQQRPGPPPTLPQEVGLHAIKKSDKDRATIVGNDGEKYVGQIVNTAARLKQRIQFGSIAETVEPLMDQASTSELERSQINVPNNGEPS